MAKEIFTLGHSTRSLEEFLALLKKFGIIRLVDIRTVPRSRHNPQFNRASLADSLKKEGIAYEHLALLGGLRTARKDPPNSYWRNLSFRGFADYMGTEDFERGLRALEGRAEKERTALLCAEALPWRCHRSLVADALTSRGWRVFHIQGRGSAFEHRLNPAFRQTDGRISYPD